jgi:membrane protease YdiL (CAAX protease family)
MTTRNLAAEIRAPMRAALMAIVIAVAAYGAAPMLVHELSSHAVQLAQSLIIAPVIEELFFRGVVQSRLRAARGALGRPWVAIGVTAVCFGLAHLLTASVAHAALVIAPAVVIGWTYERTRSIGLCIALHSASNAVWIGYWSI